MDNQPYYIALTIIVTTLATLLFLYKAAAKTTVLLALCIAWLILQTALSMNGFYKVTTGTPPRFALLVIPPVVFIIALFLTKAGRNFIDGCSLKTLTLLHVVRVPVELVLYWLFLYHTVPLVMTFEGRNFDIISGLTAPVIYYFGFIKKIVNNRVFIVWNAICLLLLINIVVTAVLSAPFSFQKFGFEQPNIALLYFPYVWLPCFIVPAVLFAHLASIRQLLK